MTAESRNTLGTGSSRIENTFKKFPVNVDPNQYDRVFSFFRKRLGADVPAEKFTSKLFRVSQINKISIDEILEEFKKSSTNQMSAFLAYYLNTTRSKSVYLGVSVQLLPPENIARNVRA